MERTDMKRWISLWLVLIAAAAPAADRPPRVTVTLDLPAQSLLPGVPFDITVIYRNLSHQRVAVGAVATIVFTSEGGHPTRMKSRASVMPESGFQAVPNFVLEPGETRSGMLEWSGNWLFEDASVTIPGTYEIALDLTGNPNEIDDDVVYVGPIHSSTAKLTRIQPTGEDAVVWARLSGATGNQWPSHGFGSRVTEGDAMSDEVIAKHASSGYYPYALLLAHHRPVINFQAVRDAVQNFRLSPAYPQLLIAAGNAAHYEARMAANSKRPSLEVERYLNLAQFYYEEAGHTGSVAVKTDARTNAGSMRVELEDLRRHPRER
jgi:hypothetical protein